MALVEIKVPDIGDFAEVSVIELLVKPGDTVTAEQSLITVESDKASMEIPSSAAGVVKELKVKIGDKVKEGSVVLMLEAAGSAAAPAAAPAPVQPALVAAPPPQTAATAGGTIDVAVPDIGDFKDIAVIEVFVKPGDTVKVEQSLITVESDKASMEIPSSHAGVVKTVLVKVGDKVSMGSPLVVLEGAAGAASTTTTPVRAEPAVRQAQGERILCPPTIPPPPKARCRMPLLRSASSRANSARRSPKSKGRAPRAASHRLMCRASSRA